MGEKIIHFRTKNGLFIGNTPKNTMFLGSSNDFGEIREAHIHDDARDIAWNKSTIEGYIYAKSRNTPKGISILLIRDANDDKIKGLYASQIQEHIKKSTLFYKGHYQEITKEDSPISDIMSHLKSQRTSKEFIIIICTRIDTDYYSSFKELMVSNDVVFVVIFHPSEITQDTTSYLFESRLPTPLYFTKIHERISEIQGIVHSLGGNIIISTTDDDIVLRLNSFFKHRYG